LLGEIVFIVNTVKLHPTPHTLPPRKTFSADPK